MRRLIMLALGSVFALTLGVDAQAPIDPHRFEPDIQKFEAADKANPPAKGASSSSVRRASRGGRTSPSHSRI